MELEDIKIKYIDDLKIHYNHLLDRMNKGETYLKNCSEEELNKRTPLMEKILNEMNLVLLELQKLNIQITSEIILEGFKL